ncbi:hypothetical protein SKAU_G00173060 [Synaphobranchus kaupii]|uniref:Uncharacterized protein n=1 Tax=Synaphobranchus kaupii TaxID=118154 RepID=A0A9Q1J000_SYNKA|nr:hypothetical protein SKAU_G00173060 [Synaphobranchus kaupii]
MAVICHQSGLQVKCDMDFVDLWWDGRRVPPRAAVLWPGTRRRSAVTRTGASDRAPHPHDVIDAASCGLAWSLPLQACEVEQRRNREGAVTGTCPNLHRHVRWLRGVSSGGDMYIARNPAMVNSL